MVYGMLKKWKNPYIDLLETKPDYILPCQPGQDEASAESFLKKCSQFNKIACEPCSGSGAHLIAKAASDSACLHIGFELRYKRAYRTAEKAEQQGLKNLFIIRDNARNILNYLAPASIDKFYINFPDPWEKKHWKKHRLLNEEYLKVIGKLLKNSGKFSYKTDHQECFNEVLLIFERLKCLKISKLTTDLYNSEYLPNNVSTEFENLFLSKNLPIYFLEAEKS